MVYRHVKLCLAWNIMSSQDHAWEMQTYPYRLVEAISLGAGTLPILTSSYRFYFNARMAIFVHRCKCTPSK